MLTHYTNEDLIIIAPQVTTKESLFEKMVNHLYNLDYVLNQKEFLQTLIDREKISNTELMPGIALPHARSESVVKPFLSIVIKKEGIEYDNPEMGKAKIIFFFGTSEKYNKEYLQLLAKSARILRDKDLQERLINCSKPAEVIALLNEFDRSDLMQSEVPNRYLMLITLHLSHRLHDLLTFLVELNITNASVTQVSSLNKKLTFDVPAFSGLYYEDEKKQRESYIITCAINDINIASRLNEILKENNIDFAKQGTGFIQIIESDMVLGNPDEVLDL
ncbi:MAG: PTS sugar transporter subunit IIA [Candidatus Cloacimonas sp.]|jgi:mannitol/fructose-specific phosphotransferase system IIA component (Ntr-type)|nr:PTS sugar transporter subunit IIA [Candidatus Cloacimonadota bacterium]